MLQRRSINRSALKTYAPKARSEFIAGVTARAAKFGITKDRVVEATPQGDLIIIGAEAFSRGVGERRQKLLQRIALDGFEQTMEEVAYTWFNRFLAIRFMELHGYLEHGYRVLSHPGDKELPEILEHAEHLELPGLDKAKVIDLKLDGTKDAELYRLLLIAQCNALHRAMPFLFEKIDDETELLLPDNLLHTDSLIRKLVSAIDEVDWQEIEIIGWLYQFYISEKKDQVIGKVVKSEDIPAATQLFTPNWIVKYMVQNALGAQWLATYPDSPLKEEMQYYVQPAEQTEEVKRQLAEITPKELNPEELTLIDPACGSGHILVEAYDLFKAIYLERGYRLRDIPRLILEKNVYGLDIDDRAAQMAGFALLMKARADDRRILSSESAPVMHVMAIQESKGLDAQRLAQTLLPRGRFELIPSSDLLSDTLAQATLSAEQPSPVQVGTIAALLDLFAEGKTFGSLITVPAQIAGALPALKTLIRPDARDDIFQREAKQALAPLVDQAELLACLYEVVVANPPYMGGKNLTPALKSYIDGFNGNKSDLYAAFLQVTLERISKTGRFGFMTPFTWLSLQSFRDIREDLVNRSSICSLVLPEYHSFFDSAYVPVCTFCGIKDTVDVNALFYNLKEFYGADSQPGAFLNALLNPENCQYRFQHVLSQFRKIPENIIAPSLSKSALDCFDFEESLGTSFSLRQGLITGDNDKFLRFWHEIGQESFARPGLRGDYKWFPYQKGGEYRKWYGNNQYVVNWSADGNEIRNFYSEGGKLRSRPQNLKYYFREGGTWTSLTVADFAMRYVPPGYIYDAKGPMCIAEGNEPLPLAICLSNSKVVNVFLSVLAPTMDYSQGPVGGVPLACNDLPKATKLFSDAIRIARADWDSTECSWDFGTLDVISCASHQNSLKDSFKTALQLWKSRTLELRDLEEENNRLFIKSYQLQGELTSEVPLQSVTLIRNATFRYGADVSDRERENRLRDDVVRELLSYAIGCTMGRYSLEEPGLIYASGDDEGFDPSRFGAFPADADGIVPITEMEWFDDDAASRFEEFLKVVWGPQTVRENLRYVAESLAPDVADDTRNIVRNYFSRNFFKDHLKTYQRRPIYWLFSSGKLKAFECLVYLHRYNESTLSRMRMEYVVPLQSRMAARIDQLGDDVASASSSAARTKAQKEKDLLARQLEELRAFDEELRHYADQRIALDLDDGVKVNYGKFGNLLAERKAVTGEK